MNKKPNRANNKDFEALGRMLVSIYETGYIDRSQSYKNSFIKGLIGGLGGVIGATIGVALLLWILALFKQIPLLGPVINSVRQSVQTNR